MTPIDGTFSFTYDGSPTPPLPGTYTVVASFTAGPAPNSTIYNYANATVTVPLVITLDNTMTVQSGTIAGGLQGTGGINMTGPGTATLNGPNSYMGGTFVTGGTLIVTESDALPDGTSLTVGAGGTFIFDPSQRHRMIGRGTGLARLRHRRGIRRIHAGRNDQRSDQWTVCHVRPFHALAGSG